MFLKRLSHLFPPVCFIFWLQHFNISHHTFRANKPYLAFVLRMEGSRHFAPSLLFAASTTCFLSKRETSVVSRSSTGWRTSTASPSATSGRRGGWTRSTPRPSSRRGSIAPQRCGGRDSLGPLLDPCISWGLPQDLVTKSMNGKPHTTNQHENEYYPQNHRNLRKIAKVQWHFYQTFAIFWI